MRFRNFNSREGFDSLSCILISLSKRAAYLAPLALRNCHTASPLLPLYHFLFFAPLSLLTGLFFKFPGLHLLRHTHTHYISASLVAGCLLLGSLWYLGSDKSPSHCALPSASQAALQPLYASLSGSIASNSYGKPPWL